MKSSLLLILLFIAPIASRAQCSCRWIEQWKDSAQLIKLGPEIVRAGCDELSLGFFWKNDEKGNAIVDYTGRELLLLQDPRHSILRLHSDSTVIAEKSWKKDLLKIHGPDSVTTIAAGMSDIWFLGKDEYLFTTDSLVFLWKSGVQKQVGQRWGGALFMDSTILFDYPIRELFDYRAEDYPPQIIGYSLLGVFHDKIVVKAYQQGIYYSIRLRQQGAKAELVPIVLWDTLKWGTQKCYLGTDGETIFYIPESEYRLRSLPFNSGYKNYKGLKRKDFIGPIGLINPVREGKNSVVILPDTLIRFDGKLLESEAFQGSWVEVIHNNRFMLYDRDSLVLYELEGDVWGVSHCQSCIITKDEKEVFRFYDWNGRLLNTSTSNGFLFGNYYFDEETGKLLFKLP